MKPVMRLDAVTHSAITADITPQGTIVVRLQKRPFLARLWRSYRVYRGKPLYVGRWRAFWLAWHTSTL